MNLFFALLTLLSYIFLLMFAVFKLAKQLRHHFSGVAQVRLVEFTKRPLSGALIGTFFTTLLQSSTAVTVITITLVSAEVLPLLNAYAIIIGANVGTTLSSQLVANGATLFGPVLLVIGFLAQFLKHRITKYSKSIFYLGLVFVIIQLLSQHAKILGEFDAVTSLLTSFTNIYLITFVGACVAALLQSSSVITFLVIIFVGSGVITTEQALGLLIGANVGTSMTGLIASLPLSISAQRVAIAHTVFNLLGIVITLPILGFWLWTLPFLGSTSALQVVNWNILFNVLSAVLALVFFQQFVTLVTWIDRMIPRVHIDEKDLD